MQRPHRNIDEPPDWLQMVFNQQRQTSIDEELFDVISGFEAWQIKAKRIGLDEEKRSL
jgi:F-type H+-transporting ATPase subunit gamma